jgi:hypothetical protein
MDDFGMNRADLSWIVQGLQTLLRLNGYIQGSAFACGAAGRVLMLDKIVLASAIQPIANPPNRSALVPNGTGAGQSQQQPRQTGSDNAEGIPLLV